MAWRVTKRPATVEDRDFALAVHHAAYHDIVIRQFGRWSRDEQDRFFDRAWDPAATAILLADDTPCGYLVVEERTADIHVREIVIHPDWQRQGIGTTILQEIVARATEQTLPVVLGTFHVNPARQLYKRLGFVEFDATETHVLMRRNPDSQPG